MNNQLLIRCLICLEEFNDPITLPETGQTYCRNCIVAVKNHGGFCLQTRRSITSDLTKIATNYAMQAVVAATSTQVREASATILPVRTTIPTKTTSSAALPTETNEAAFAYSTKIPIQARTSRDFFNCICSQTLEGHNGSITCLTKIYNGKMISGSADHTIKVWDSASGRCLHTLQDTTGISFLVKATLNPRVVSANWGGSKSLKVWDIEHGTCSQTCCSAWYQNIDHKKPITCLEDLLNGLVVSGSDDHTIKIWDSDSGYCLHTLQGHTSPISCLATFPDKHAVFGC
jgi:WD40 repeat protein